MILLPDRKYGTEELNIICIHELIHCKHRDILWKQLCEMIRMIHWWNPLVKQLNQNVDAWNETYCDLDSIEIVKSKKLISKQFVKSEYRHSQKERACHKCGRIPQNLCRNCVGNGSGYR